MGTDLVPSGAPSAPQQLTDVAPRLLEVGGIRVGRKNDQGYPQKLDYFLITDKRRERCPGNPKVDRPVVRRDIMDAIAKRHADEGRPVEVDQDGTPKVRELDVMLIFDAVDLSFYRYRGAYTASRLLCKGHGAGTQAERFHEASGEYRPIPCPGEDCDWTLDKRCRPHGVLKMLLLDDPMLGGVYVYRTTSPQTIGGILGGLRAIEGLTGGHVAGLPMRMRVMPHKSVIETAKGRQTVTYPLVTIGYAGQVRRMLLDAQEIHDARVRLGAVEANRGYEQAQLREMARPAALADPDEVSDVAGDVGDTPEIEESGAVALPPQAEAPPVHPIANILPPRPVTLTAPEEGAAREALLTRMREAVDKCGGVAATRGKVAGMEVAWVQPSKATIEQLSAMISALEVAGVLTPREREPGEDDDGPF